MIISQLYVGDNKQQGFFNIPPQKKVKLFTDKEKSKNLAEIVIEKAIKSIKDNKK